MNEVEQPRSVLDASALLAVVKNEIGSARVGAAIREGALISAVNWAEVLTTLTGPAGDRSEITAMALPGGAATKLVLVAYDDEQARETARLVRYTRHLGLSLADRAALALARLRRLPVLTSDRAWRSLRLPITIEVIR